MDLSGDKSTNVEDRRGDFEPKALIEKAYWLQKSAKELQSISRFAADGTPFFPSCPADPSVAQLKEKLVALGPGLAERQNKLERFAFVSLDQDLSYNATAVDEQIDTCKGSFRALKKTLTDRKGRLMALKRELEEAVAPGDRQTAAEALKLVHALVQKCPDRKGDLRGWLVDSSTEDELGVYVRNFIFFRQYLDDRLKDIDAFEARIHDRPSGCGSIF